MKVIDYTDAVQYLNAQLDDASQRFDDASSAYDNARDDETKQARAIDMEKANARLEFVNELADWVAANAVEIAEPQKPTKHKKGGDDEHDS